MRHRSGSAPRRLGLCAVLGLGGLALYALCGWLGGDDSQDFAPEFDYDASYTETPYLQHSRQVRTRLGFGLLIPDNSAGLGDGPSSERMFLETAVQACRRRAGGPGAECTMADVGANVGYHALHVASLVGRTRVVSWECNADTVRFLRASLRINPRLAPKVTLLETAASDRIGHAVLSVSSNCSTLGDVDESMLRITSGRSFQMQVRSSDP
jgi:FkbM family methyltransferase